jgi:hypothetical protein
MADIVEGRLESEVLDLSGVSESSYVVYAILLLTLKEDY